MFADPTVLEELKRLDPYLSVEFLQCDRTTEKGHKDCPRIAFSRRRACNRWVVYRQVFGSGVPDDDIDRFYGKEWANLGRPMPEKILVFVWQDPRSKSCFHICGDRYAEDCCRCGKRERYCDACVEGAIDGMRPFDMRLVTALRKGDNYETFRSESNIRNLIEKQFELQVKLEEAEFRTFSQEAEEGFARLLVDGDANYYLNLPEHEAIKRLSERDAALKQKSWVHGRPEQVNI
jgi:hypothetical protein